MHRPHRLHRRARPHGVRALRLLPPAAASLLAATVLVLPPALAEGDGDLGSASDHGATASQPTDGSTFDAATGKVAGRYLVAVDGESQSQGNSRSAVQTEQSGVQREAKSAGIDLTVQQSFTNAWNGMTVTMDDADVAKLRTVQGVEGVYPVVQVALPEQHDADPEDAYANAMTGVDEVQKVDGLNGKGVTVGVIDSGIDYNNPDLGGSGVNDQKKDFPGTRVVKGYDFVGDDYDSAQDDAAHAAKPDAYPDDCGGHGTHVAGIVGASGEVTGVAPQVNLAAYRVFGCEGSSDTATIMAAMDRAFSDGVDVINMSLGASFMTWGSYPTAQLADELMSKGVVVVTAGGNDGEDGTFSGGAPGVAADAISVGSVENTHAEMPYVTVGDRKIAYASATGAPAAPTSGQLQLVSAGAAGTAASLACDATAVPKATAADQALLVSRGTCTFRDKAAAAQSAGYAGIVIANNSAGIISPTVEGSPAITIPVISITMEDGQALQKQIAAGGAQLTWTAEHAAFANPGGGLMSSFSSYGLTADLTLKPDVSAPGGQIWSTLPLEEGGHGSMSGTSMASPHVAGAVALLLQEHPDWTPEQVKSAIVNTADPMDWSLDPGKGYLEPVHRQGAGLLDMVEAAATSTRVEQPTISLGDSSKGRHTVTVKVRNDGSSAKTYAVGVRNGVATSGSTEDPEFTVANASVRPSTRSVTIQPHRAALISVRIGEDFGEDGIIYGGWIELTSNDEDLSVPFAGLSGDYQALTTLTDAGMGLPALAKEGDDGSLSLVTDAGASYSMTGTDLPYLIYHLEYPVSRLEIKAYTVKADGTKGKLVNPAVGTVAASSDEGRDSSYQVYAWDGQYPTKNDTLKSVKDGQYILEIHALKALGDPKVASDWETWDSPAFTVSRTAP